MINRCERIEELLPEFVAGDLAPDDAAAVSSHVESCKACREAMTTFAMLETALISRREDVPAVDTFLRGLSAARRTAPAPAPAPALVRALRTVTSMPGISILLMTWAALLAFNFRSDVAAGMANWSVFKRWEMLFDSGTRAILGASGGDSWTLIAVYVALTLAILATAGRMTLKYIKS